MSSPKNIEPELREHSDLLIAIAHDSIESGLNKGRPAEIKLDTLPDLLRRTTATFVTLLKAAQLRGCIGTLEAREPLALDIAANAFNAAFRDPRFPALTKAEFPDIDIEISILTPPQPLAVTSEADLLQKIRPGIDGLIIESGSHRGTFLPSVWKQLPTAEEFLKHLKMKAGLAPNYWSDNIRMHRYTAIKIP
jgi:hypothetical protein